MKFFRRSGIPEDRIPRDANGKPDLSRYRKPAAYYRDLYLSWWPAYLEETDGGKRGGPAGTTYWSRRTHGQWGLIARGAEAVPHAMELLQSANPDFREDGAGILGAIGRDDAVVEALADSIAGDADPQVIDAAVIALGQMRNRAAVPALARLLTDSGTDGDTADLAARSLGQVVRRRFDRTGDPVGAAREWLRTHGQQATPC